MHELMNNYRVKILLFDYYFCFKTIRLFILPPYTGQSETKGKSPEMLFAKKNAAQSYFWFQNIIQ